MGALIKDFMSNKLRPVLKPRGYVKKGNSFLRQSGDMIYIINIQGSCWNKQSATLAQSKKPARQSFFFPRSISGRKTSSLLKTNPTRLAKPRTPINASQTSPWSMNNSARFNASKTSIRCSPKVSRADASGNQPI